MGHINKSLDDALNLLNKLKLPNSGMNEDEMVNINRETYQKISGILSHHIASEEQEVRELNKLLESLRNYKKHIQYAKIILDKDFTFEGHEAMDRLEKQTRRKADVSKDMQNAKRQLTLAQKEWHACKGIIKHLIETGNLRLE